MPWDAQNKEKNSSLPKNICNGIQTRTIAYMLLSQHQCQMMRKIVQESPFYIKTFKQLQYTEASFTFASR